MSSRPSNLGIGLRTTGLPALSEDHLSSTASPARGRETKLDLLGKLRPPPFVYRWVFWHEKQGRKGIVDSASAASYSSRLTVLAEITDVKDYWQVFNNFPEDTFKDLLQNKGSIHLFHLGTKPLWEDPRNEKGGCWIFKVQKQNAEAFWKELSLMAIGDQLQEQIATKRQSFNDDICGISFNPSFQTIKISVWHRDAANEPGKEKLKKFIMEHMPAELLPKDDEKDIYYKKHIEHQDFKA